MQPKVNKIFKKVTKLKSQNCLKLLDSWGCEAEQGKSLNFTRDQSQVIVILFQEQNVHAFFSFNFYSLHWSSFLLACDIGVMK